MGTFYCQKQDESKQKRPPWQEAVFIVVDKLGRLSPTGRRFGSIYEGANVGHGDIGSHCALIDFDGKYCLCTGYGGYEIDLTLLSLEKGSFTEYLNLKSDIDGSYYKINGEDASEDQWKELYLKIDDDPEEHFHSGYLTQSGHESREALQEAVSEDYKLLGM